jgi:hypothetical protein
MHCSALSRSQKKKVAEGGRECFVASSGALETAGKQRVSLPSLVREKPSLRVVVLALLFLPHLATSLSLFNNHTMQSHLYPASTSSSAANSPSLPLLSGFDSNDKEWDSPSLPLPRRQRERDSEDRQQRCWTPPTRAFLLPLTAVFLVLLALLYFALAFPSTRDSYLDSVRNAVHPAPASKLWNWMHDTPERALDEGGMVVVDATEEHTVTAIVLHGLAGSARDWPFVQTLSERYPYVKWCVFFFFPRGETARSGLLTFFSLRVCRVSPTADYREITVRNGESTRAWFNIK